MDPEQRKRIIELIKKTGFPSEILLIQHLQQAGWRVEEFDYFCDVDKDGVRKVRAIDAWANKDIPVASSEFDALNYSLICEVKKSQQPWIIFDKPVTWSSEGAPDTCSVIQHPINQYHLDAAFRAGSLDQRNGWLGTNVYELNEKNEKRSESDRWYDAAMSVCKAAKYWAKDSSFVQGAKLDPIDTAFWIYKPVVVLDGDLLLAQVGDNREVDLQEIDCASIKFPFGNELNPAGEVYVDLVSLAHIEKYLIFCEQRNRRIAEGFEKLIMGKDL